MKINILSKYKSIWCNLRFGKRYLYISRKTAYIRNLDLIKF